MKERLRKVTLIAAIGGTALSLNGCSFETGAKPQENTNAPTLEQIAAKPNNRLAEAGLIFAAGSLLAGTALVIYIKDK